MNEIFFKNACPEAPARFVKIGQKTCCKTYRFNKKNRGFTGSFFHDPIIAHYCFRLYQKTAAKAIYITLQYFNIFTYISIYIHQ